MGFVTAVYIQLYDLFGGNEKLMNLIVSHVCGLTAYIVVGLLFMLPDLTGRPKWMLKFKVQPSEEVTMAKFFKAIKVTSVNMLVVSPVLGGLLFLRGGEMPYKSSVEDIPGVGRFVLDLCGCLLIQEAAFYYSHRMLHYSFFYKYIHKKHHEFTAPFSLTATYAHPVEHVLANILPVVIGPMILKTHLITAWVWIMVLMQVSLTHHSGYHLPLLISPQFHDFHHLKFNACYGTWGILDWLHGTDHSFKNTIQGKRHITLLSLRPISELIPDTHVKEKSR